MNGRERILAAFHGRQPDFVPFAPNIYQWFFVNHRQGTLPVEVADAMHPFDVLRQLGADILARWDAQGLTRAVYSDGEFTEEWSGETEWNQPMVTAFNTYPPRCTECRRTFRSPHGTLTNRWFFSDQAVADFETDHWWTSWDQYEAIRFMLEARDYVFDADKFDILVEQVADDGVFMVNLTEVPLKTLHWLAGAQNATYFLIDHPAEMQVLAQIQKEKVLDLLERIVDHPSAEIFITHDNLDTAFFPPYFYKTYCQDFFTEVAEIVHSRGKIFVSHACGRSRKLLPLVGQSRIDCLEGITPPPAGDVQLGEVREMVGYDNFTVNGGMDAARQEIGQDAEEQLHAYTSDLFESMGDKRHFIYASSCNTSPLTPWRNLMFLRDAARAYGQL
ncbi:MAG: uroporphyrinogen decarboxylase family protein [Chloroflexota bacterium]|nr:uroporphyrinogen decarboxylase family protein [Chloroflexota bacterium]